MTDKFELIIIGAGPAGLSAAIYAARKKIKTLIISSDIGGQANWSADVENFIGFHLLSGAQLIEKFKEHLADYALEQKLGVTVLNLIKSAEGDFEVQTDHGNFTAPAIIVASGKFPRLLNVPGEKEYRGKGVTYCAVCDGPLYKNLPVAVIGGGNSALDAIISLRKYCPEVFSININSDFQGDAILKQTVISDPGVKIEISAQVQEIYGDQVVQGLKLKDKNGLIKTLAIRGVFVEIGYEPSNKFLNTLIQNGQVNLDAHGEIILAANNTTTLPGLFAAGDISNVAAKQIIVAAGEGAKAALSAYSYLVQSGKITTSNASY